MLWSDPSQVALHEIPSFKKSRHRNELISGINLLYYAINHLHNESNRKSSAVCNHCFLKYTKDPGGKIIDGDCANWEISYGLSKSTSKLNNHLSFNHKEIYEAHNAMKAVTTVAGGGTVDSHVVYG